MLDLLTFDCAKVNCMARESDLKRLFAGDKNLRYADLSRVEIVGADLTDADLAGADLATADLPKE